MSDKNKKNPVPSADALMALLGPLRESRSTLTPIEQRIVSIVNSLWANISLTVRVQTDGTIRPFDANVIKETTLSALAAAVELEGQLRTLTDGLEVEAERDDMTRIQPPLLWVMSAGKLGHIKALRKTVMLCGVRSRGSWQARFAEPCQMCTRRRAREAAKRARSRRRRIFEYRPRRVGGRGT